MKSTGFSVAEKSAVTAACRHLIDDFLKPRFLPTIRPTQFNYPVDIYGKWHGTKYRFIQRYRSGFLENLGEEFDAPFARLDWISRDRFSLQWHRHTGEWFCLYRGLTLAEAIDTLKSDELFHPHRTASCLRCSPNGYHPTQEGKVHLPSEMAGSSLVKPGHDGGEARKPAMRGA